MVPEVFGPYELNELIGRGRAGEVYRAYDTRRQRTAALKRLTPELVVDEPSRGRLLDNLQRAARVADTHVVAIHDFGVIDGGLYIDMPLIKRQTLAQLLASSGPLSPASAVAILTQVASALDAAHAAGLVHHDVTPSNVLVDAGEHCYLTHFGVAQAVGGGRACPIATPRIIEAPDYGAPESLSGQPVDRRADVYSLACLLHEALTGQPPSLGRDIWAMEQVDPAPVSLSGPAIPTTLLTVIACGTAKNLDARFGTAGQLAAAARAALAGGQQHQVIDPIVGRTASVVPQQSAGPGGEATQQWSRPSWGPPPVLLVTTLLLTAVASLVAMTTLVTSKTVYLERVDTTGARAPFIPQNGNPGTRQASVSIADNSLPGNTPGLYGGTQADVCDATGIRVHLDADPDKAKAWARAMDIDPGLIPALLESLTAVALPVDTAVTNHGFENGVPTPFQSVLQSGTPVLVDAKGLPRVRCYCGTPLQPPAQLSRAHYEGPQWAGFSAGKVIVVKEAEAPVAEYVIMSPDREEVVIRPQGTRGEHDRSADPAVTDEVQRSSLGLGTKEPPAPEPPPAPDPEPED